MAGGGTWIRCSERLTAAGLLRFYADIAHLHDEARIEELLRRFEPLDAVLLVVATVRFRRARLISR